MKSSETRERGVVAVVGVGTMGRIVLERIAQAGYTTAAYDPVASAQEYARAVGARVASSPSNAADGAEVILLSLPGPAQLRTVVAGSGGVLDSAQSGQIIVDLSTVDPGTTRDLSRVAAEKGVEYLDAPILGRPASVGAWVVPVGGSADALDRCRSVLKLFASRAVSVGASGAGNTLKLLNQLMFSTINGITAEVMAICRKSDLDPAVFFETVESSGAATVSGLFRECGRKIVDGDYSPVFSVELLCKDAGLGLEMAKEIGAPAMIAAAVQSFNLTAKSTGLAADDGGMREKGTT